MMIKLCSFTCATPGTVLIQCCASSIDSRGPRGLMRTATLTLVLLSIAVQMMMDKWIYSLDIISPPGNVMRGGSRRTNSMERDAHSPC